MIDYKLKQEDLEYLLEKQKEGINKLQKSDFNGVIRGLKEPLKKIEEVIENTNGDVYCPQNIFDTCIFLNCLGKEVKQEDFPPLNFYDFYLLNAAANFNLNNLEESKTNYEKALKLNPASDICRVQLLNIKSQKNDYENFLDDIYEAFYFAYRRVEIGHLYKYVGDYLKHIKDYEMSVVAYCLSALYDLDDEAYKCADEVSKEGKFSLEDKEWLSEEYMNNFYQKYKIPLMPNERIIQLAEQMGDDAYNKKVYPISRFSYGIAYDLTLDEKYKKILEDIQSKIS